MEVVVIGGAGLIGSKLFNKLTELEHEAIAAPLEPGVDNVTGEGLAEPVGSAQVVVDESNSPSFDDEPVLQFFTLDDGRGSIVKVTTMAAFKGIPGASGYSASKAAVEALTPTWAAELGSGGAQVNNVAPGRTRTDRVAAEWDLTPRGDRKQKERRSDD